MSIRASQDHQQHFETPNFESFSFQPNMPFITTSSRPRTPAHSKNPSAIITLTDGPIPLMDHLRRRPSTPHTSQEDYSPTFVPASPVEDANFTNTLRSKLTLLKRELDTRDHMERISIARNDSTTSMSPISRDENEAPAWLDALGIDDVREPRRNIPDIWKIHQREQLKRSVSS